MASLGHNELTHWGQDKKTDAENNSNEFEPKKDTPYLGLTGELWGIFCKDLGENWQCYKYNGTVPMMLKMTNALFCHQFINTFSLNKMKDILQMKSFVLLLKFH